MEISQESPIPLPPSESFERSSRVYEGALLSNAGGEVQQAGVSRFRSSELQAGATSIMGTTRNNAGFPTNQRAPHSTTVELIPGDPSSRTSLATAVQLGYLTKNEHGEYVEVSLQETQQQEQPPKQQVGPELFDAQQEEAYSAAIADIPQPLYDQAVAKAARSVVGTGSIADMTASIASTTGLPVEQLQQAQGMAHQLYQAQADNAIKALGVDPSELYQWARENQPEQLGQAVLEQLTARSLDGYRTLTKFYLDKVPPGAAALTRGGYETKTVGKEEMVNINGMWTTVKAAARMGLI